MNTQIIVELPEKTYRRAERLAQLTSRGVADVLADTLELSLPAFDDPQSLIPPVADLSDEDLLALTELQMEAQADSELSSLLYKQQAGELTAVERKELAQLMQVYQEGLLRKAQALAEAVKRGLIPHLIP
jgi:hypothetical protein